MFIDVLVAIFAIVLVGLMAHRLMQKDKTCDCDGCPGCGSTICSEKK